MKLCETKKATLICLKNESVTPITICRNRLCLKVDIQEPTAPEAPSSPPHTHCYASSVGRTEALPVHPVHQTEGAQARRSYETWEQDKN